MLIRENTVLEIHVGMMDGWMDGWMDAYMFLRKPKLIMEIHKSTLLDIVLNISRVKFRMSTEKTKILYSP